MRVAWLGIVAACGGGAAHNADAPTSDAAADAAVDAPPPPDPWTAALGDVIPGVTLSDGWTDLRAMLPPMAITGGWTDSLFALPAGGELRFAYEQEDFFDVFIGTGQVTTGPVLAGVTSDYFKMFDATLTDGGWVVTPDLINSPDPALVEASPATNASDDLYIFTRFDPVSGHSLLYYSELTAGSWSAATELPINAESCNNTDNAKLVGELATSVTLVFESTRGDDAGVGATCGNRTLYYSTYASGAFHAGREGTGRSPRRRAMIRNRGSPPISTPCTSRARATPSTACSPRRARVPAIRFANIHPVVQPTTTSSNFAGNDVVFIGEASVVVRPEGELLYMMCAIASNTHGGNTYGNADDITLVPCVARRPS